jgi:hypothetical protein
LELPFRDSSSGNNSEASFPWRERGNTAVKANHFALGTENLDFLVAEIAAKPAAAKMFAAAAKSFSNSALLPVPPLTTL